MVAEAFPQWAAAPVADAPPGSGPVCRSGALRAPNAEESRRAVAHRAGFDRRCKRFKLTHHSRRGVLPDRVLVEIEICEWPG